MFAGLGFGQFGAEVDDADGKINEPLLDVVAFGHG
jgi:hypothetical protein